MQIGLEAFLEQPNLDKDWGRCALLCNQASVAKNFKHAIPLLQERLGKRLVALLGPQHGLVATVQDNMIETNHNVDTTTGLPIFSLYSETREPTQTMLANIDTIIIDLQIVGCRVYTFKATIRACLEAAKKFNKKIVIFDRPNPLGGSFVEGRTLDKDCRSFVGPFEIPMRHGLTVAEATKVFNSEIGAHVEIIAMQDWKPWEHWNRGKRPWILTSPNLPTCDSVTVYPGMVMIEGTNLSEGRGTALPFQLIGAPYIKNSVQFVQKIHTYGKSLSDGLYLRATEFMPTSGKWANQTCQGFQIHVIDPELVTSFFLAVATIRASIEMAENSFKWKEPPYEYEYHRTPMELIIGSSSFKKHFEFFDPNDSFWTEGLENSIKLFSSHLLYDRQQIAINHWEP